MTQEEQRLVRTLRIELFKNNYPEVYAVDLPTLEAAEKAIMENLESINEPLIIKCGKYGPYFKGSQLVLKVEYNA